MKHIFKIATLFCCCFTCVLNDGYGQNAEGAIKYNRKIDNIEILASLDFLSEEEIQRQRKTWGKRKNKLNSIEYTLYFSPKKTTYMRTHDFTGQFYSRDEVYILQRDIEKGKVHNWVELLAKKYVLEDKERKYKWKVLNELKEVAGYICMKAVTYDSIHQREVIAWFTNSIPVAGGPEGFYGLPGMILALDFSNGAGIIEATEVNILSEEQPVLPKKMRGKKIDWQKHDALIKDFVESKKEAKENPYWNLRY